MRDTLPASGRSLSRALAGRGALALAISLGATACHRPSRSPETDLSALLARIQEPNSITRVEVDPSGLTLEFTNAHPHFQLPFRHPVGENETLRLTFEDVRDLRGIYLYYQTRGHPISVMTGVPGVIDRATGIVDFRLGERFPEPVRVSRIRIDLEPRGDTGRVHIVRVALVPDSWLRRFRANPLAHLAALAMAAAVLLPGTLLFVRVRPGLSFEGTVLAFSLLFYLSISAVLDASLDHGFGLRVGNTAYGAAVVGGWGALLWSVRSRLGELLAVLKAARGTIASYFALTAVACFVLTYDHPEPLRDYHYRHVSAVKTFGLCGAHDNYFQYVNALAIANHEPFSRYYGNARLTYDVTAREILPGVVYSVLLRALRAIAPGYGDSYLVYTFFGVACDLMLLFPLVALVRRYHRAARAPLVCWLTWSNACVFVVVYYTWFKAPGAALWVGGLIALLEDSSRLRRWLWAGLLFGMAANMHAGTALALPVFFAWFSLRHLRSAPGGLGRRALAPLALVAAFVACLAPWSIVKREYLHEDNTLIVEHFFEGRAATLGEAARSLFRDRPLGEQAVFRAERVWRATRLPEVWEVIHPKGRSLRDTIIAWTRYETLYPAFLLYPLVLFTVLGGRGRGHPSGLALGDPLQRERRLLIGMCVAADVLVIFAAYSAHQPDLNWSVPLAMVLVVYSLLVGGLLESPPWVRWAYFGYSALSTYRLLHLTIIDPAVEYFPHL